MHCDERIRRKPFCCFRQCNFDEWIEKKKNPIWSYLLTHLVNGKSYKVDKMQKGKKWETSIWDHIKFVASEICIIQFKRLNEYLFVELLFCMSRVYSASLIWRALKYTIQRISSMIAQIIAREKKRHLICKSSMIAKELTYC